MISIAFGSKKIVTVQEVDGSKIRLGGYSITYDQHGTEIERSPITWSGVMECHTIAEAKRLFGKLPC